MIYNLKLTEGEIDFLNSCLEAAKGLSASIANKPRSLENVKHFYSIDSKVKKIKNIINNDAN